MALVLSLLLQAAASSASVPAADPAGAAQGLQLRILPDRRCASSDSDEIVVCGRREDDRYQLRPLDPDYEPRSFKIQTEVIDGVVANLHADSATLPNGMIDKRVMVTFKMKF